MGVFRKIINSRLSQNGNFFIRIKEITGFSPNHLAYYRRAFTHRSLQKKDEFGNKVNYERLEFLGDAVLGTVVAAYLFEYLPEKDEGELTQMRAKIVSRQSLNELGKRFELMALMEADSDQQQLGKNIYGNLLEAFIGAIYMDKGYVYCEKFIRKRVVQDSLDIGALQDKIISFKSYLIEWCQKQKKSFVFENLGKQEEDRCFTVELHIGGEVIAQGRSISKKEAEEKAAKQAYFSLLDQPNK